MYVRITDLSEFLFQSGDSRAAVMSEDHACMYDQKFEQLPARNVSLSTFLQSYKYFQQVEDQLRRDLTFKPHVLNMAYQWLELQTPAKWRGLKFVRVMIHIRRQDYAPPPRIQNGWSIPTADYVRRSASYFVECLERVQFVVLSDDPAWCIKNINVTDTVFSIGHRPIFDMAVASLCDHAIISIGTFGWWAAWFANGITITPKETPIKGTTLAKMFRRDDYYKPQWIGL